MKDIIKKCLPTYEIVDKIGEGIHGSVFKIKDKLKERAVKIVPIRVERSRLYRTENDLDTKVSQDFHAVREYYEKIKGEGVISVYDFHLVDKQISKKEAQAHLVILMELCPVNLQDFIIDSYPLSRTSAISYMYSLVNVLVRLSQGTKNIFLLTDFKPSNLLVSSDNRLLIGDLGGLKRLSSVSTITNAQFTPNWSAPELVMMGERPTVRSAIYSYGLVSYYIWEGQLPYENEDFIERIRLIKEKSVEYENSSIPQGIRELISKCLKFSPEDRPESFDEILEQFKGEEIQPNDSVVVTGGRRYRNVNDEEPVDNSDYSATMDMLNRQPAVETLNEISSTNQKKSWLEPRTGMEFVWIQPGHFLMGGLKNDNFALSNEKPVHKVQVEGFWIGRYPVTQEQWKIIMGDNPSHFIKTPEHPVEQISWNDAARYCNKLTAIAGNGKVFSLPMEKQWEYAARGGMEEDLYAGGNDIDELCWYKNNSLHSTHPVGRKQPNGLGLFDMCGNVMEWCEDLYVEDAYKILKGNKSPKFENEMERVVRGGGYNLDARRCRASARRRMSQGLKYINLGLRVVMMEERETSSV